MDIVVLLVVFAFLACLSVRDGVSLRLAWRNVVAVTLWSDEPAPAFTRAAKILQQNQC
jgi:hypothetical protein